ncbi:MULTISPECIES: DUF1508 domain-containing protein [unclassified Apibacter]|uniref:DUF1508 domain-containing protein n=1 Tax=unclassified Apibacter TaxID=2630820 RepID=UPI00135DED05|nr:MULTISPECIES: DUF1508 domain-containing protein [unclassified Apibacter]MXP04819.1 DUF1508 domain-containing protein [Apibacter sp. B3546]MXP13141.1 DUF1508 domain-containing protein [Apibacter sp. B3239]
MKHSANKKKFYFEIHTDEVELTYLNYRFYFDLINEKGEIILKSFSYTNKIDCQKVIKSVLRNSKNKEHFIIKQAFDNTWIVFMEDGNGIIIAFSQYFDTEKEVKNLIKDLNCLSLKTPVIDKTK